MFIDNWYQMSVDTVAKKLKTDKMKGLDRKATRTVLRKQGKNIIYPVSKISFYNVLKAISMDYSPYLLIATALIAAIFEETVGAWTLVTLVVLNLCASVLAYTKSQRMLESMDRYTLPVVRVIREGRLLMIDQKLLVQGDLICLSRGDIVPADARLIYDKDLVLDETNLFGSHCASVKKLSDIELHETLPPEKQRNMVFASTIVIGGEGRAIITATGEDTIVVFTEKNRPIITHEKVPVLAALKKISRVWSLIVIAAVFFLTILNFAMPGLEHSLFQSFIKSMSYAVSTMSEMYIAFGYIVLACAVFQTVQNYRESGTGAIIKNPLCMENLRHMTCLIVPKDGIFTIRDTVADRIFAGDRLCDISDRRSRRAMERPILFSILSTGLYGEAYLNGSDNRTRLTEEETSILNLARNMNIYNVRLDRAYPMLEHRGRDEYSKFETTLVKHKENYIAISRGETEELLADCSYYYKDGKVMLMTPELRSVILAAYRKLIKQAYSVSAVASRGTIYNSLKFIGAVQKDMVFEGFVAFRVPYLRGIGQLVDDAKDAGIKVIMTSERQASEEVYFARQLGIVEGREQCVDSAELHNMKEGIRRTNASYYRLYCGLDSEQKEELLDFLHDDGEIVGIVGHRLDDLQLLRRSDISIAQNITVQSRGTGKNEAVISKVSENSGEDGCEALKFTSDILVSDASADGRGGFQALIEALKIAKNTEKNIIRIVKYLLSAQTARLILVIYTILFGKSGMSAVQTLFLGLVFDFITVMILAFRKPDQNILTYKKDAAPWLTAVFHTGIPSFIIGICWAFAGIVAAFVCDISGLASTELEYGSVLFVTNSIITLLMLLSVERDEPVFRPGIRMSTMQVLYLLSSFELFLLFFLFPRFGTMFGVARIAPLGGVVIAILCVVWLILAEAIKSISASKESGLSEKENAEAEERHAEQFALFQLFRQQKEQEETAAEGVEEVDSASANGLKLHDMQEYIRKRRAGIRKEREKKRLEKHTHASETLLESLTSDENAGEKAKTVPEKKKKENRVSVLKKQKTTEKKKQPQTLRAFLEEEKPSEQELALVEEFEKKEAMYDALLEETGRESSGSIHDIGIGTDDMDEVLSMFEGEKEDTEPDTERSLPDLEAFEAAVACRDRNPFGFATTDSITVGNTKNIEQADDDVQAFLRGQTQTNISDEDADKEFTGSGYLYSEEDYDAIISKAVDRLISEGIDISEEHKDSD